MFRGLTKDLTAEPAVKHAMEMRRAWSSSNYSRFFRLYPSTPNHGRNLVNLFIERERKGALRVITKA